MPEKKGMTPEQRQNVERTVREYLQSLDPEEKAEAVRRMLETGELPTVIKAPRRDLAPMEHAFIQDEQDDADEPSESEFE